MVPVLAGLPVMIFGGKGFLLGGIGLGGKGGRRVPGITAGFFVECTVSTDTFLPVPGTLGACLIPVPTPFLPGIPLGLGLAGLVLSGIDLTGGLSDVLLGLTVVASRCGA